MDNMMSFCVSSPGKIILHGEHSVVYHKPALAATIGLRTYLKLHQNNSASIKLNYESLGLLLTIPLVDVNDFLKRVQDEKNSVSLLQDEILSLDIVKKFASAYCKNDDFDDSKLMAINSTCFLLFNIFLTSNDPQIRTGFEIDLSSELRIGAGLGSSASFSVSLAACFLILSGQIIIKSDDELTTDLRKTISDWALKSEKIMHTNPSGIDNTVCSFGNIIRFQKGEDFKSITLKCSLHILLVDSKISRSTAKILEKVSQIKNELPNVFECIFNGMGELVNSAIPLYENYIPENNDDFAKIKCLFQINNDLLKSIGVSHPRLEEIFSIATKNGFSSKITGAGGGGFAIILLPNDYKCNLNFQNLCSELTVKDFEWIETTIGENGLRFESI